MAFASLNKDIVHLSVTGATGSLTCTHFPSASRVLQQVQFHERATRGRQTTISGADLGSDPQKPTSPSWRRISGSDQSDPDVDSRRQELLAGQGSELVLVPPTLTWFHRPGGGGAPPGNPRDCWGPRLKRPRQAPPPTPTGDHGNCISFISITKLVWPHTRPMHTHARTHTLAASPVPEADMMPQTSSGPHKGGIPASAADGRAGVRGGTPRQLFPRR